MILICCGGFEFVPRSPQLTKFLLIFSQTILTNQNMHLVGFEVVPLSPVMSLLHIKFPLILRGMTEKNMRLQYSWLSYGGNTHTAQSRVDGKKTGWDEYQSPTAAVQCCKCLRFYIDVTVMDHAPPISIPV